MLPRLPGNRSMRPSKRCRFRLPSRHPHIGPFPHFVVFNVEHIGDLEPHSHRSCSHLGCCLGPSGPCSYRLDAVQLPIQQYHDITHRHRFRCRGKHRHRHSQDVTNRLSRWSSKSCNGWKAPRFGGRYRCIGFRGLKDYIGIDERVEREHFWLNISGIALGT